ncbi:hypothetical protein GCM10027062_31650 [Nocardioides hungaricus]
MGHGLLRAAPARTWTALSSVAGTPSRLPPPPCQARTGYDARDGRPLSQHVLIGTALDLALDEHGVDRLAHVVHRNQPGDADLPGVDVDLHLGELRRSMYTPARSR